ncbi:MAG: polysaccharide deacetylase family protein [Defluviitaleaceae bacterium]|nr:polysaccharide deacetylase family protein [Defluviitaleaceae bacterium]MCL2261874.1 polysaccharide deacetylase family protein [Defluviitaleaceae bacterium]
MFNQKRYKHKIYRAKAGWTMVILLAFVVLGATAVFLGADGTENVLMPVTGDFGFTSPSALNVIPLPQNTYSGQAPPEPTPHETAEVIPVYRIPTRTPGEYRPKIISLTFDDGPSWLTEYLLDTLYRYNARVTFCVIGDLVEEGAETVIRAFEAGHEIIGHSWDHQMLTRLSAEEISEQITKTSAIIEYVTGETPPPIFRAPFGQINNRVTTAAYELGYSILNWSIDPEDWRERCEYHIYEHIMEYARDGAIVILHDIHPTTIYAMEKVIPSLISQGFHLVTATELIYHIYGDLEPAYEFTGVRR